MMLRTPPPKKQRPEARHSKSGSDTEAGLIVFEDPVHEHTPSRHEAEPPEQMLCTYQCRQMVKADFFEALNTAEKQARDYHSKLEELNAKFIKSEAERKTLHDQLLYIEQDLAASKGRENALQEQILKEFGDSQERLKKQLDLHNKLEVKLGNEMNLRKKAEHSATSAEEKVSVLERKVNYLSESSERDKRKLTNELDQMKLEYSLSLRKMDADLGKMECRAKSAEQEADLLKNLVGDLEAKLNECMKQRVMLEKNFSNFATKETSTESEVLVKHLKEELKNCESELINLRKLKSSHENAAILKERLLEEQRRRERVEAELLKYHDTEKKLKELEDELSLWQFMIKDMPDVSSRDDVPLKFAALQKELLQTMSKVGDANARVKQLEVVLDTAQFGKLEAESEVASLRESLELLKLEAKQTELVLRAVTEERNALKNAANELKNMKKDDVEADQANQITEEHESSLLKMESCIQDLERILLEHKQINLRQLAEIKLLNDKLYTEGRRIKSIEREADRLRGEVFLLESKLGHGDFSATNTKVLRMINTLGVDDEAKQTIEALQSELHKANERLQAIEELKSQSGGATVLVDSHISEKIARMKEQIATLEKREGRYKSVFADRISVFRRACSELFGYKIVMDERQQPNGIPITRFTLQSIYSETDDEKLEFDYESGNVNILENEYTTQPDITRQVEVFIHNMNSIPAFTANLTVESFNRRSFS